MKISSSWKRIFPYDQKNLTLIVVREALELLSKKPIIHAYIAAHTKPSSSCFPNMSIRAAESIRTDSYMLVDLVLIKIDQLSVHGLIHLYIFLCLYSHPV